MIDETDVPPPISEGYSTSDCWPDSAAYWWDVKGHSQFVQNTCECENRLIGKEGTQRRWTLRICAGRVSGK